MLERKIERFINEHSLIVKGERVLAAYSGGPDSTCLLMILRQLFPGTHAVYVNHQLRGRESQKEERFVRDFCRKRKIPLFVERVRWKSIPSDLEQAARKRRYRHLAKVAAEQGFHKIALAHHKDDVVETFLLRLIRGAGPQGLRRMTAQRDLYVRPMLESDRKEILDYLRKKRVAYFTDTSNEKLTFTRNRIRKELIPYITRHFNPAFPSSIERTARWFEEQNNLLAELLQPFASLMHITKTGWGMSRSSLLKMGPALQKAVLRMHLTKLDPEMILSSKSIQDLVHTIRNGGSMELPGFLKVNCTKRSCTFSRKVTGTGFVEVDVPTVGKYKFPAANLTLTFSLTEKRVATDPNVAFLDAQKATFPLHIRNWKTGDSFSPLGMKGTKKLSDYFIDRKIPRNERKKIPLVYKDDDLLWVSGHQIHNDYRISPATKNFLRIEVKKNA